MRNEISTNRVKELRKAKGFTQQYLAECMKIAKQSISRIEAKEEIAVINEKTLISLCHVLECTQDYLKGTSSAPNEAQNGLSSPLIKINGIKGDLISTINRIPYSKIPTLLRIAGYIEKCNSTQMQILEDICSVICKKNYKTAIKEPSNRDKLALEIKESLLPFVCNEVYIFQLPDIDKSQLEDSAYKEQAKETLVNNYCFNIESDFKDYLENIVCNIFLH